MSKTPLNFSDDELLMLLSSGEADAEQRGEFARRSHSDPDLASRLAELTRTDADLARLATRDADADSLTRSTARASALRRTTAAVRQRLLERPTLPLAAVNRRRKINPWLAACAAAAVLVVGVATWIATTDPASLTLPPDQIARTDARELNTELLLASLGGPDHRPTAASNLPEADTLGEIDSELALLDAFDTLDPLDTSEPRSHWSQ